jgi:hypothetical protein
MKHFLALIALLTLGQTAYCKEEAQTTLYETKVSPAVTALPNSAHVGNLSLGPDGRKVAVRITWSVGKDESGCLRLVNLKVVRVGDAHGMAISNVKHAVIPDCMMKFDSPDSTRYQTAMISLNYESRILLKTYSFSGGIASIQGNGVFTKM